MSLHGRGMSLGAGFPGLRMVLTLTGCVTLGKPPCASVSLSVKSDKSIHLSELYELVKEKLLLASCLAHRKTSMSICYINKMNCS